MIKSARTFTLNDSTYTAVTLGDDDAFGFSVHAVDDDGGVVAFYFATDSEGTDETLAGIVGLCWSHYEKPGDTVMYAKALSGEATLVLRPGSRMDD